MPRKKVTAPTVHDEDVEDSGAVATEEPEPQPEPKAKARKLKHAEPEPDDLPEEDAEFLKAVTAGAVKDVEIPRIALEASDWGETVGRTMKLAMEAMPNGVRVEIVHVKRARDGSFYAITLRTAEKGSTPVTATIETREWLYMRNHNKPGLGKWFRRVGNALLERELSM